ncbi:hypothetical protein [Bacillus sp. ISL-45]|uniref:hypothetical protein n=1 Tax=Bacillus sp. ISL-45 TaxID=2819128 RepID=UPI001BEAEC02|nr:hypothetical protein [Bacillus sp. ISL-45]MBT2660645.1 hypothetical protein [Bacillus sp. ISL-45]
MKSGKRDCAGHKKVSKDHPEAEKESVMVVRRFLKNMEIGKRGVMVIRRVLKTIQS